MLNIIKQAAIYTGVYFIIFNLVFWAVFFASIALQVFAKLFIAVFFLAIAVLSFDHFNCADRIKKLFAKKSFSPRGGDIIVAARKEHAAAS